MITTDTVKLDRTGLATVPPGTGKKAYSIACYQKSDWEFIHSELKKDGSIEDNIPSGSITVTDEKLHSDTRGTYMLTDAEAEDLRKHDKVRFVNIDYSAYPGTFQPDPGEVHATPVRNVARFKKNVSNYRAFNTAPSDAQPPTSTAGIGSTDKNRTGYQILRHLQRENPWDATTNGLTGYDHHIFERDIYQLGDGTGVDAVVSDDGFWIAHPEFVTTSDDPPLWKPGNALTWSGISTTAGTCGVLDVLLDGPYYIDPDYFNADPGNRLTQRWDGTTVPTDQAARDWWSDSNARSVGFSTIGTVTGFSNAYSRSVCLGDNNNKATNNTNHGTQCAGQVFGKNYGSAYNCNRWVLNSIGGSNCGINDNGQFDILKIFHLYKPNYDWRSEGQRGRQNPDKNPTLSSNSWGYRSASFVNGTHYWYIPSALDGSVTGIAYTTGYYQGAHFFRYLGGYGDSGRMKGEMVDNSSSESGKEMSDVGVIFVCAAGNSNQTQCAPDSPEFNNYWADNDSEPLQSATHLEFGLTMYNTFNRRGWPQSLGKTTSGLSTAGTEYAAINIGALDDQISSGGYVNNTDYKERIVNYSDKGTGIDCYGAADDTLTADGEDTTQTFVHPETYAGLGLTPYDKDFGGTSSACPTCAGWITTKLQHNRDWTWRDIKNWLKNQCGIQDYEKFYKGNDCEGADNPDWDDVHSLQGGDAVVIWDAPTGSDKEPQRPQLKFSNTKGVQMSGIFIKFT